MRWRFNSVVVCSNYQRQTCLGISGALKQFNNNRIIFKHKYITKNKFECFKKNMMKLVNYKYVEIKKFFQIYSI